MSGGLIKFHNLDFKMMITAGFITQALTFDVEIVACRSFLINNCKCEIRFCIFTKGIHFNFFTA